MKLMLLRVNRKDSNETNNINGDEISPYFFTLGCYGVLNRTLDMDAPIIVIAFSNGRIKFRQGIEENW